MTAILIRFAISILLILPGAAAADTEGQPLSINLHGDGARATQLPQYDPGKPIAVSVTDAGQHVTSVSVLAQGPAGESIQTPLDRGAGGDTFTGTLTLSAPGSWSVRLTSHSGSTSTQTLPVMLDVEDPPPSNAWQIGLGVGIAIFVSIGGGGFWLLRRLLTGGASRPRTQSV